MLLFGEECVEAFDGWDLEDVRMLSLEARQSESEGHVQIPELDSIEDPDVRRLCERCLSVRAADRPSSAELLGSFMDLAGLDTKERERMALYDIDVKKHIESSQLLFRAISLIIYD